MKALICGCGPSLDIHPRANMRKTPKPWELKTYAVNDAIRWLWYSVDNLVLLDEPTKFEPQRRRAIIATNAHQVHYLKTDPSHVQWDFIFPDAIPFGISSIRPDSDLGSIEDGKLWFRKCSPTAACWLAFAQGATDIALIGVDLYDHPYLKNPGIIDGAFGQMREHFEANGATLVNCSQKSALESMPKVELEEWLA